MADEARSIQYVNVMAKNRAGEAARILASLKEAGIELLAFSGFPSRTEEAQIVLITDDLEKLRTVARENEWRLSRVKKGFLVWGKKRVEAAADILARLAEEDINITAVDAVSAGKGRFGMILWVKPTAYARAAKVLKAK